MINKEKGNKEYRLDTTSEDNSHRLCTSEWVTPQDTHSVKLKLPIFVSFGGGSDKRILFFILITIFSVSKLLLLTYTLFIIRRIRGISMKKGGVKDHLRINNPYEDERLYGQRLLSESGSFWTIRLVWDCIKNTLSENFIYTYHPIKCKNLNFSNNRKSLHMVIKGKGNGSFFLFNTRPFPKNVTYL